MAYLKFALKLRVIARLLAILVQLIALAHITGALLPDSNDQDAFSGRHSKATLMSHYLHAPDSAGAEPGAGGRSRANFYGKSVNQRRHSELGDFDYSLPTDSSIDPEEQAHSSLEHNYKHKLHSDSGIEITNRSSENLDLNHDDVQQQQQRTHKKLLTRELIREACLMDRGSLRDEHINNSYLNHCSRYKLENMLSSELLMSIMHHDTGDCERLLDEFVQLDEVIEQFDKLFRNLLTRYNCHNGYSVKWSCEDCKIAYTDWLCAMHLPFYMNGERIKPCVSFCERVEQRCPYLHPITREQYGGQPVFICRDPNIPFVPTITPDVPYNEPGRCYDLCHVSDNLTELITDSLSKYDYNKCPDRNSIAEEIRNDPFYCGSAHCNAGGPNKAAAAAALDEGRLRPARPDSSEEPNETQLEKDNDGVTILANETAPPNPEEEAKIVFTQSERRRAHLHKRRLDELREVLANYKNQAKTHRYHADHSSIYRPMAYARH